MKTIQIEMDFYELNLMVNSYLPMAEKRLIELFKEELHNSYSTKRNKYEIRTIRKMRSHYENLLDDMLK